MVNQLGRWRSDITTVAFWRIKEQLIGLPQELLNIIRSGRASRSKQTFAGVTADLEVNGIASSQPEATTQRFVGTRLAATTLMSRSTTPVATSRSGGQQLPLGDQTGDETIPFVHRLGESPDLETRGQNGIEEQNHQEVEEERPRPKESVPVTTGATTSLKVPLSRQKSSSSDPGYVYYNHPTKVEPDHACGMRMQGLLPSHSENCLLFVQANAKFTLYNLSGEDDIDYTTNPGQQARPKNKPLLRDKVAKSLQPFLPQVFRFLPQPQSPLRLPWVAHRRLNTDSDEKFNLLATIDSSGLVLYWNQKLSVGAADCCDPEALFTIVQVDTKDFKFYLPDGYLGVHRDAVKEFTLLPQSHPPDGITTFHFSGDTSEPCNEVSFTAKSQKFVWVAKVDPRTDTGHVEIKAAEDVVIKIAEDVVIKAEVFSISQPTPCHPVNV